MTIRLKGAALTKLRRDCFERDKRYCRDCGRRVYWDTFEMAHVVSRGRGGDDTLDNVVTKCPVCHGDEHRPRVIPSR